MNPHDERGGLVSASKFEIAAACEGQQQMEQALRAQGLLATDPPPDEAQARGIRMHSAWETGDTSGLAEDELADFERTKQLDEDLLVEWYRKTEHVNEPVTIKITHLSEQRLWLHDSDLQPLTSGRYDKLTLCGTHAYVRDLKSGWSRRLTPSQQSWQLRLLAVLVWEKYGTSHGLETVRAAFIKPKLRSATDIVEYSVDDLYRSRNAILQILWRSKQPDAQRVAGDHCYWCPCRTRCPEAGAMSLLPSVVAKASVGMDKAGVYEVVERMTPADWKYVWERSSVVRNVLAAVNDSLKALPEGQLADLGLKIGEGRKLDPITNTVGLYTVLEHQLPAVLLWQCLSFEKGKLEQVAREHLKLTEKDAKAWVKERIAPFITPERAKGSLEEV